MNKEIECMRKIARRVSRFHENKEAVADVMQAAHAGITKNISQAITFSILENPVLSVKVPKNADHNRFTVAMCEKLVSVLESIFADMEADLDAKRKK